MFITPVGKHNNLFQVQDLVPDRLLDAINSTDWLSLPNEITEKQSHFVRKSIIEETLPWTDEWRTCVNAVRSVLWDKKIKLQPWHKTTWWVDEPGFYCPIHLDDPRVEIGFQMFWIGDKNLGTTFYNSKNLNNIKQQFEFTPNSGYIALNINDTAESQNWHAMTTPVPKDTFRLTSYTWFTLVK